MANRADPKIYKDCMDQATLLQANYGGRAAQNAKIEQIFFMDWGDQGKFKKQMDNAKITISPDGRNAANGAWRLMIASDPVFSVPSDANDIAAKAKSEPIEKFANQMWMTAGKVAGSPIHYDAVLSAILYSDVNIAVTSVQELQNYALGKTPAFQARIKDIANRTPYLFNVWSPTQCYPRFDRLGLNAHYRVTKTTVAEILNTYGSLAGFLEGEPKNKEYNNREWWDLEFHCIGVEGKDTPILAEAHKLPFIPIVSAVTEGSTTLWSKPEQQRQPFLYAVSKSGFWERQNLALSVLYTMLFSIGANPMFLYEAKDPNKKLIVDYTKPGGMVTVELGEKYGPLAKIVIDPSVLQGLSTADQKIIESTMYRQALGEPLGGNPAGFMVSLLNQAGRLPLSATKQRLGWAIAEAVELAFKWMRFEKKKRTTNFKGQSTTLFAKDIPDPLEIEAQLEIDLPQDQLQMAQIADAISGGENPLVSQKWARENILHIGQSDEMTVDIWRERASQLMALRYWMEQKAQLDQMIAAAQQALQAPINVTGAQATQPAVSAAPGGPQIQPPGLSPEMMQGGQAIPQPLPGQQTALGGVELQRTRPELMRGGV